MTNAKTRCSFAVIVLLCLSSWFPAQEPARPDTAEEKLAAALVAAKTEAERTALLVQEKELVTVELVKALVRQGDRLKVQGNYAQALAICRLAGSIAEHLGDQAGMANALNGAGNVESVQGNYPQALESYRKSLTLRETLGDQAGMASTLNNIGIVHFWQGSYPQALEDYRKSLALREGLGDQLRFTQTLNNIGVVYYWQRDYAQALEYYRRSLTLYEALGNKVWVAQSLHNIGNVYSSQSNYGLAMEYYRKSLALHEEMGNKAEVASTLNGIGIVYKEQGSYPQALEYYRKSLALHEEMGNRLGITSTLVNIGLIHQLQGNYAQALENYQKSLALSEALGSQIYITVALTNIGLVHQLQGNYAQALDYYRKSLALDEASGEKLNLAFTLGDIAVIHYLQGNYPQALEVSGRAASLARQIGNRETLWPALTTAGRAYRALSQPAEARQAFEEAIAIIESVRAQIAGGEQEQQRFFENKVLPYQAMVELLLAQHNTREAFAYAERAKARVLLDVLSRGRVNITKAMTASEQAQEQRAKNELVSLNTQLSRESLRPQPDAARLSDLRTRLQKARLDYEAWQTNLYAAHPELKMQRGEAQPLTAEQARDLLPDAESALAEFMVAEEQTYLFVLTRKAEAGQTAAELKVYPLQIQQKELAGLAERFRQQLATRDPDFRESAGRLYNLLLAPAQAQLRGKTNLVIVPDGALWGLPFQALQTAERRYLLEDSAVSYAPSLAVLREMVKARAPGRGAATPTLLALGNPALGKETVERVRLARRDERLDPLPEAEKEVKTLGQVYGQTRSKVYIGAEAREDRVKAEAGQFSILHLATHGILDDASPMYSHVVLSQAGGGAGDDGLLEAWELMGLNLKADLVVLSACETARGRVGAGEGVIGLTWALFVAGAPTTVVSQWKVDSASTTELMLEFHRRLKARHEQPKAPLTKAGALREAALKVLRGGQYRHPFYWAGFVVVGDGF